MPQPQEILSERWRLFDRIGEGAMGEVWRGQHVVLGHEVAIKVMKPEAAADRNLVSRFRREARIAAMLRHRNLVRVEDFGSTADGRPFLVMELLRGRSLAAVLQQSPRLDRGAVALFAAHIGAACDVAHAAGIVHRDLKPDNCYVVNDDDGSPLVKVLDFGVAKVIDSMFITSSGVVTAGHALMGTPMYMSPEQARGLPDLDGRSDLWSLAVMVYEMLAGRLPYSAPTISQLLYAVLAGNIPPPSRFEPTLGPSIDTWFTRALHRDRALRFQTGRELAQTLAATLGVAVRMPSLPPPAPHASAIAPARASSVVPPSVGSSSLSATQPLPGAPPAHAHAANYAAFPATEAMPAMPVPASPPPAYHTPAPQPSPVSGYVTPPTPYSAPVPASPMAYTPPHAYAVPTPSALAPAYTPAPIVAPRPRGFTLLFVLVALFATVMVTAVIVKVMTRDAGDGARTTHGTTR